MTQMLNTLTRVLLLPALLLTTGCIPKGLLPTCVLVSSPEVESPEPIALTWDGTTEPTLEVTVVGQSRYDDDTLGEWDASEALALIQVEDTLGDGVSSSWTVLTRELSGRDYGAPNRVEVGQICAPVDATFTFVLRDGFPINQEEPPEAIDLSLSGSIYGPHEIELWDGWLVILDISDSRT